MSINTSKYRDYDKELWAMVGERPYRIDILNTYRMMISKQDAIRTALEPHTRHLTACLVDTQRRQTKTHHG